MTGKDFKEVIKKSGLKQTYISNQIGTHPVTLNNFLNGKSQLRDPKIARLKQLLGIN